MNNWEAAVLAWSFGVNAGMAWATWSWRHVIRPWRRLVEMHIILCLGILGVWAILTFLH